MKCIIKKEVIFLVISLLILPFVVSLDSDKDGIPNNQDEYPYDFDNDGMPDEWEARNGLRFDVIDSKKDPDNDGLLNLEEFEHGTDPHSGDSDGDEIDDFIEIYDLETDPLTKNRTVWPLVVFPILIIFFVFVLFLFEKYKLDLIIREKFRRKSVNEEIKPLAMRHISEAERPDIEFKNLDQIYKSREQKKRERERILKTLGVSKKTTSVKQKVLQKKQPKTPEKQSVTKKQATKEDVFEKLKKIK